MFPTTSHAAVLDCPPAATKPYRLAYELRPGYLYVHFRSDTMSYDVARQYWSEIVVMVARTRSKCLLVDKEIVVEFSVADAFRITSEIAAEFNLAKLAICDRHAEPTAIEFEELVATNRGLNMRSFRDAASAEQWLLQGA